MKSMTLLATLAAGLALATPASAEMLSCWTRDYSEAHLASHPDQVVRAMWLSFHRESGENIAHLSVLTSSGGHVARSGDSQKVFDQSLFCFSQGDAVTCAVDCDGGSFTVSKRSAESMDIATSYLMVGDTEGCGGAVDLAERPGQRVVYRLYRSDDAACETN